MMDIDQDQPRTFSRDDIRIEVDGRQITLKHSHWLRRRKPDSFSLEDVQSIYAMVEEPWVLCLIFRDVHDRVYRVDETMSGWRELLVQLPTLLSGFEQNALDRTQRRLRDPMPCWERKNVG